MPGALSYGVALIAIVHATLEVVLARRALAWLGRRCQGRVLSLESGRVRLLAVQAVAGSVLALAAALGGARYLAEVGGAALVLPMILALRAALVLPFAAWARILSGSWDPLGFLGEQGRRLGRDLGISMPLAALTGLAVESGGGWPAAWLGLAALLTWREMAPASGRRLSPAPEPLARLSSLPGVGVFLSDEGRSNGQLNARAEGIGRRRRIILTASLVEALPPDEVAAVLTHEEGHLRHRHREWFLAWRLVLALAGLGITARLAGEGGEALTGVAMLLASLPVVVLPFRPLETLLIRHWEGQADRHAAGHAGAEAFARALEHLYGANATAPAPEPLWAAFHHPHPAPSVRLGRLRPSSTKVGIVPDAVTGAG